VRFVLDTHVLIRWCQAARGLPASHRRVIRRGSAQNPLLVSDITLWEIAMLHSLGRIRLSLPLREWLERATAPPLVARCGISPAIATEVASLPASFPRDPADRIIVATALVLGATLLTSDARIIDAELVPTLS